jgi:hypothetical protein
MNTQYYRIDKESIISSSLNLEDIKDKIDNYHKRDLYFFDNIMRFDISSLNIKKNCIICKLDSLKAIIFKDECYILYDHNYISNIVRTYNTRDIFHLHLLESFFTIVIENLDNEFNLIFNEFSDIDPNNKYEINDNFITLQSNLLNLEYRIKELHSITNDLLEDKEELKSLTFTELDNHEICSIPEELIENCNLKIKDVYNDISKLVKEMDNVQKITNIKLAKDRNKFAIINLYVSFMTLSISFGSFIGSMYGMNLINHLEDTNYAFGLTFFTSFGLVLISLYFQVKLFRSNDKHNPAHVNFKP